MLGQKQTRQDSSHKQLLINPHTQRAGICHYQQGVAEAWLCLGKGAYHHSLESDRECHGLERMQYQAEELDLS